MPAGHLGGSGQAHTAHAEGVGSGPQLTLPHLVISNTFHALLGACTYFVGIRLLNSDFLTHKFPLYAGHDMLGDDDLRLW